MRDFILDAEDRAFHIKVRDFCGRELLSRAVADKVMKRELIESYVEEAA